MSFEPYPIQCYRDGKWVKVQIDEPRRGDVVSLGECLYSTKGFFTLIYKPVHQVRQNTKTTIPTDLLLVRDTRIVNEAMSSDGLARARESLHICLMVIVLRLPLGLQTFSTAGGTPVIMYFSIFYFVYFTIIFLFVFAGMGCPRIGQGARRSAHLVRELARCSAG